MTDAPPVGWLRRLAPLWILLAAAVAMGLRGAGARNVPGDFLRYHRAGRLVATGQAERLYDFEYLARKEVYAEERAAEVRERGDDADDLDEKEFKYLPATAVLLAPLGSLHPRTANVLWEAWNGFLVAAAFLFAWRFCARGVRRRWIWLPLLGLAHVANDNINLGQLNPTAITAATLAVVVLGVRGKGPGFVSRHKGDIAAGLLAAFGGVVKFMPAFLVLWFAWKRRWVALLVLIAGMGVFGWGIPAVALGPARATALTAEYFEVRGKHYTSATSRDLPGHSIKSFVYRTLGTTPYRKAGRHPTTIEISIADLPPRLLFGLVLGLNLVLLGLIAWRTWGPLRAGDDPRGPPEAALFVAALLLISPEARGPHFLYLTLPLIALTCSLARARASGAGRARPWMVVGILLILALVLLNTTSTRLFGRWLSLHFTAVCALGWAAIAVIAGLWVARREAEGEAETGQG